MKFKILLGVALTAILFNEVQSKVNVVVCGMIFAGTDISCKQNILDCGQTNVEEGGGGLGNLLNSAVDASENLYDWKSIARVRTENLGVVKGDMMNFSTLFPATGQKKMVQFTPTTGQLKGRKVSLLFVSFNLNGSRYPQNTPEKLKTRIADFRKDNKQHDMKFESSVYIFGQIEGGSKDWYQAGFINLNIKPEDDQNFNINMQVMADGRIKIVDDKLLDQTGADGATAHRTSMEIDFSKVPEVLG